MDNEPAVHSKSGWKIHAVLGVCAAILLAIFLPLIRAARDSAREIQSGNNLRQLGLANQNYTDTFKRFPIGADVDGELGKHGWFTRLMPYLEASSLYNQLSFKVHWEHPVHRHVFYYNYGYPFNWQPLTVPLNTGKGSFGGSRGGVQLVMADSSLRFISDSIDVETLRSLADAPPIASPEETQIPSRLFEAAKPNRFTYKYFEEPNYDNR